MCSSLAKCTEYGLVNLGDGAGGPKLVVMWSPQPGFETVRSNKHIFDAWAQWQEPECWEPLALSIFQGHLSFITNPFKWAQNLILEGKFSQVSWGLKKWILGAPSRKRGILGASERPIFSTHLSESEELGGRSYLLSSAPESPCVGPELGL